VRNPALLLLHSLVALAMGLVIGLTFFDLDYTNIGGQRCFLYQCLFFSFFSLFPFRL
jgi:hypothetical protein